MSAMTKNILNRIPAKYRDTAMIRMFGMLKVPMLFWIRPSVIELSDERCEIKIPLSRRTKNHLNSMYFGVLACGADCAGGLSAMKQILQSDQKVSLAFKEFDAKGWMYQQAIKDSIRDWVGPGYIGSFYDAYSKDARKLFCNIIVYSHRFCGWGSSYRVRLAFGAESSRQREIVVVRMWV